MKTQKTPAKKIVVKGKNKSEPKAAPCSLMYGW
jgi:hypothetical protein